MRKTPDALIILLLATLSLAGCGDLLAMKEGTKKTDNIEPDEDGSFKLKKSPSLEFYSAEKTGLQYTSTKASTDAWIFLVAGSIRGANFGQEVIDQKLMWLARGVSEDEIACYFVIPDKENFDGDADQYSRLAEELSDCHLASMQAIANDLQASADAGHDDIYIYVTTHGSPGMSYYADKQSAGEETDKFNYLINTFPILDEYSLSLDTTTKQSANLGLKLNAIQDGEDPDALFLTPRTLASALSGFSESVAKTLVLQGCYSGGFIKSEDLSSVPNIEILTAARDDRPSFGCGLDDDTTYFGSAVQKTLDAETTGTPDTIDWQKVYKFVDQRVLELELAEDFTPSEPQYYSNK